MAVPGVFAPVSFGGRVLIDGGAVNIVPYDHVMSHCEVTIAVDVGGTRVPERHTIPGIFDAILGTFDIMQEAALAEKMKREKPDIYVKPELRNIRMLEIDKIEDIFDQARPSIKTLRDKLSEKISNPE
jgi:NTE family protein